MQAILIADYSFTPLEYWRHVSGPARQFINRCLTIDPVARMTAHEALSHPWLTADDVATDKKDLLPTVKKNFNARRTLHAAIDTVRAINQLRAGGAAAMGVGVGQGLAAARNPPKENTKDGDAMEGVVETGAAHMPVKEEVNHGLGQMDPRGHGKGQNEEQIKEQERRIKETTKGLWTRAGNKA